MNQHFLIAFALLLALTHAPTAIADDKLPEGPGLAAKYPGDRGLAKDPAIVFFEDFETGDVADLKKNWTEISNRNQKVISFADDTPAKAAGKRAIQLTATVGENEGGNLYRKLPRELDTAFFRFYVKFPRDAGYIHHFVHMGGYRPATNWPQGGAGSKPAGNERMTVGIEPTGGSGRYPAPGVWNFYPYWHEMKPSVGNKYWGNSISPAEPLVIPRDTWQCVEVMFKCNTPGQRDGELALWLDGKLTMHVKKGTPRENWTGMGFKLAGDSNGEPFEGFSWRTTPDLKVNFFWLLHYVTDTNQKRNKVGEIDKPVTVWFDNVVVSEKYIGPIAEGK